MYRAFKIVDKMCIEIVIDIDVRSKYLYTIYLVSSQYMYTKYNLMAFKGAWYDLVLSVT